MLPYSMTQLFLVNWDPLWQWTGRAYSSISLQKQPLKLVFKSDVFREHSFLTGKLPHLLMVASIALSHF